MFYVADRDEGNKVGGIAEIGAVCNNKNKLKHSINEYQGSPSETGWVSQFVNHTLY